MWSLSGRLLGRRRFLGVVRRRSLVSAVTALTSDWASAEAQVEHSDEASMARSLTVLAAEENAPSALSGTRVESVASSAAAAAAKSLTFCIDFFLPLLSNSSNNELEPFRPGC